MSETTETPSAEMVTFGPVTLSGADRGAGAGHCRRVGRSRYGGDGGDGRPGRGRVWHGPGRPAGVPTGR